MYFAKKYDKILSTGMRHPLFGHVNMCKAVDVARWETDRFLMEFDFLARVMGYDAFGDLRSRLVRSRDHLLAVVNLGKPYGCEREPSLESIV
jgi:hypothetical protein